MRKWHLEKFSFTLTNWTFGFWWGRFSKTRPLRLGVDLGPCEWVFVRRDESDNTRMRRVIGAL